MALAILIADRRGTRRLSLPAFMIPDGQSMMPLARHYSSKAFTHLSAKGEAQMVHLPSPDPTADGHKLATARMAGAEALIMFSTHLPYRLLTNDPAETDAAFQKAKAKGDVLAVARIAGIQAAKQTASLIPLCHNIPLSGAKIQLEIVEPSDQYPHGGVKVRASVHTFGQTGVEMEALVAASTAALSIYDMCKAVDRKMRVEGLRVVEKRGGRSGDWSEI